MRTLCGVIANGKYYSMRDGSLAGWQGPENWKRDNCAVHEDIAAHTHRGEYVGSRRDQREFMKRHNLVDRSGEPDFRRAETYENPSKKVDMFNDADWQTAVEQCKSESWKQSVGLGTGKPGSLDYVPVVDENLNVTGHTSMLKHLEALDA